MSFKVIIMQLRKKFIAAFQLSILLLSYFMSLAYSPSFEADAYANFERLYIIRHESGRLFHKMYISVTPSLYQYYKSQTRRVRSLLDYAVFVTPETVEPIALELRSIFTYDEQFANAVLSLVHQIFYSKSGPKYPVETLVENSGDCGALSLLAASIMEAGGLDVVLLYYENGWSSHMAVGVYLPRSPVHHTRWMTPKFYEYQGKRYWVAECTKSRWEWRVGDEPASLHGASVKIIPIETGRDSPACVSARLDSPLEPSLITVDVYPQAFKINDSSCSVVISGRIFPGSWADVVAYLSKDGFSWEILAKKTTDKYGAYSMICNLTIPDKYYLRVSWSGSHAYSGADSDILAIFLGPKTLIQFKGPGFNYTIGRYGLSNLELRKGIGIDTFMSLNVSAEETPVTAEFMILRGESTIFAGNETLPVEGLQPLRLPEDFDMRIRSQLTFVLSRNGNDLSFHVKGLSLNDLQDIILQFGNTSKVSIHNLTTILHQDCWFKYALEVRGNETIFKLYEQNGTPIGFFPIDDRAEACMFVLGNIKDSIVVFRNLSFPHIDRPEDFLEVSLTSEYPWRYLALFMLLFLIADAMILFGFVQSLNKSLKKCTLHNRKK